MTVTNKLYTPTREELHRTYGGEVFPSDFNTLTREVAKRIELDFAFDEQCRKNLLTMKRRLN